ncbi:phosphate ABC transporter substrate-binding protein [Clostridium sp. UBA5119]|uniref:phosphate ABC transporter substrate-binding protein n=1 Tax=Clostridium sp. UBA5119 TaxID=1946366 RepID=UPI0032161F86
MTMGLLVGCGGKDTSNSNNSGNNTSDNTTKAITIKISGSTSVGPLMEKEAESYKGENPNVTVEVQQIGSSAGIKNAIEGISEIGMASRELKAEEKSELAETVIAYDGIALVVHPSNTAENLTMKQIKDIYTGAVTNWKEVGGSDAPIVVVSREDGSGTRDAFQEIVGYTSEELEKNATIAEGNGSVKTTVSTNENAIGYISFEQLDDSIKDLKVEGIEATPEKVLSKEYKLSRPFLVVYKEDKLTKDGKQFIDYILSEKGQGIVEEAGGIKVK